MSKARTEELIFEVQIKREISREEVINEIPFIYFTEKQKGGFLKTMLKNLEEGKEIAPDVVALQQVGKYVNDVLEKLKGKESAQSENTNDSKDSNFDSKEDPVATNEGSSSNLSAKLSEPEGVHQAVDNVEVIVEVAGTVAPEYSDAAAGSHNS